MSSNEFFGEDHNRPVSHYTYYDPVLQRTLMQRVFLWMSIGLSITGFMAYVAYDNMWSIAIASSSGLLWGLIIGQILLVMGLSGMIHRISFPVATGLFALYSVLNGLTMSFIFEIYTMTSIAQVFFISAGMFGAMALYGYLTKRDLTSWGSLLLMALVGLIIAGIVNIFLKSETMSLIVAGIGVIVFVGLTAYDVQKIKHLFANAVEDNEETKKLGVLGALTLYLDFVNLFLYLLRLLGNRK